MDNWLKETREKMNLTQIQISQKTRIALRAYQNYEYGKREPGVQTAIKIADTLKIKSYKEFKKLFGQVAGGLTNNF